MNDPKKETDVEKPDHEYSLKQLFCLKDLIQTAEEEGEHTPVFQEMKDQLKGGLKGVGFAWLLPRLLEQAETLLDVDLQTILAQAWSHYGELDQYADQEAYPPEETVLVPLAQHVVQSVHQPHIELSLKGMPLIKPFNINFRISLMLTLEGVVLEVRGGRVMKAKVGLCKGSGALACQGIALLTVGDLTVNLPGSLDFGEGIPLGQTLPEEAEALFGDGAVA